MMGGTGGVAAMGAIFQSKLGAFDPATLASGGAAAAENFTDALGAPVARGFAVTPAGGGTAAGRSTSSPPTAPRSCRAPPAQSAKAVDSSVTHVTQAFTCEMVAAV